ncbi:hypothetical protein [Levilactobacillus wangkuiensis]|uniref:hypothetical protein n=1 Tax=Levilactobacillus wangkuiensis TaxID=2799566 RepID=UPI001944726A|nr:hypothetical protein [Levilactobacillus wangkuiensis]
MNSEYFAQELAGRALQAKLDGDYEKLMVNVTVAAKNGDKTAEVKSFKEFPESLLSELERYGIVWQGTTNDTGEEVRTLFDISKLGVKTC